jgi:hypothetical protein
MRIARDVEGPGNFNTNADSSWLLRVRRRDGRTDTLGKTKTRPARFRVTETNGRVTSVSVITNPLAVGDFVAIFPDGAVAVARTNPRARHPDDGLQRLRRHGLPK